MIPIFRAKKINSDGYIIGQYIETEFSNEDYCDIEEQELIIKHCIIKDFRTIHDDYEYCNFDITEIDIATLAIHFPDMLDSKGNKIFASLQKDGKGSDILFDMEYEYALSFDGLKFNLQGLFSQPSFNEFDSWEEFDIIGIEE